MNFLLCNWTIVPALPSPLLTGAQTTGPGMSWRLSETVYRCWLYSIVLLPGGLEWRVDRSHPNFNGQLRAGMTFPCVLDIVETSNTDLCIIPHSNFGSRKTPRQFSQQTHTNPSSNAPSALQRNHFLNASLDFVLLAGGGVVLDGENEWERWPSESVRVSEISLGGWEVEVDSKFEVLTSSEGMRGM